MKKNIFVLLLVVCVVNSAFGATRAPFKVLYSNDTTHITTCVGPYHKKGEVFQKTMLNASVDETAGTGVEVHLLQPGTMWTPWWQSDIYSMQDHYKWYQKRYGIKPDNNKINEYVLNGGDLVKAFIDRCRQNDISPFISFRMNDAHFLETWNEETPKGGAPAHCLSKFYVENAPEYCVGYEKGENLNFRDWDSRTQNWAIPQVRNYKLKLIEELCQKYDFDGLELDFMRHASYFNPQTTTSRQRKAIMKKVVSLVRGYLDENSKGRHRWLCVRIPAFVGDHDRIGLDVRKWADAGVDMFNVSAHYFTCQQTDLAEMVKMARQKAFYLEMTHTTRVGKVLCTGYDGFSFRRTTAQQYYTAAHLAYSRGAAGVSAFNFQYYREHGGKERGPFNEPPFYVFNKIGDPDWFAKQPQHYVLSAMWNAANRSCPQIPKNGLEVEVREMAEFEFDMAPPEGGWQQQGKLRIQSDDLMARNTEFEVELNGTILKATSDLAEPYKSPYESLCGPAETLRGWIVPAEIVKNGINKIQVKMLKGDPVKIVYVDLAIQ